MPERHWFRTVHDVRVAVAGWREKYNYAEQADSGWQQQAVQMWKLLRASFL